MREQQPDKFEELVKRIEENMKGMAAGPMVTLFGGCIDQTCELLKNKFD
jgi:hypothetical protein